MALVVPKSRTTTKYDPVFAATRRDGANFPDFVVVRRSKMPDIRRSSFLRTRKIWLPCPKLAPVAAVPIVLTDPRLLEG
jgi:hypothetical protein